MDLFDIDPLISADVEIAFLEAAHRDPMVAQEIAAFTAEGGE